MKCRNSYIFVSTVTIIFWDGIKQEFFDDWCFVNNEECSTKINEIKKYVENKYKNNYKSASAQVIVIEPTIVSLLSITEDLANMLFDEKDIIKIKKK